MERLQCFIIPYERTHIPSVNICSFFELVDIIVLKSCEFSDKLACLLVSFLLWLFSSFSFFFFFVLFFSSYENCLKKLFILTTTCWSSCFTCNDKTRVNQYIKGIKKKKVLSVKNLFIKMFDYVDNFRLTSDSSAIFHSIHFLYVFLFFFILFFFQLDGFYHTLFRNINCCRNESKCKNDFLFLTLNSSMKI